MTKQKTIYLANPYGFSEQQRETVLPALVQALEAVGLEVWEPFERNNQDRISSRLGIPNWTKGQTGRIRRGRNFRGRERNTTR